MCAGTVGVDGVGKQLLARAGFTGNQNPGIGVRALGDLVEAGENACTCADDFIAIEDDLVGALSLFVVVFQGTFDLQDDFLSDRKSVV